MVLRTKRLMRVRKVRCFVDFLRVASAWVMDVGVQMPGVSTPIIGVVAGELEGLQQRFELQKDLVFAATKDVGQDLAVW